MNIIRTVGAKIALGKLLIGMVIVLALIAVILLYAIENARLISILGGIIGGLIIFLLNLVVEYPTYKRLDELERMQVRSILKNRHDIVYYREILNRSSNRVTVIGASCSRFITDFLDYKSDDKVLIDRLRMHPSLKVRILVPNSDHMDEDSKGRFDLLRREICYLQKNFSEQFEVRQFSSKARISAVIADDELLTGPIFEGIQSKQSPGIHICCSSEFGKKHFKYINSIWEEGEVLTYD